VLKSGGRPKGDHATHFLGWIKRPIAWSSIYKCSYTHDTIEKGPMMWMSSTMDGNKKERKWVVVKCKALKWAKANKTLPKGSPWWVPMVDGMIVTSFHDCDDYKIEET
jgi:hypothetical protein